MPLSEHEQRILEEIERRLAAEDPKFARSANAATPRGVAVRRMKRAALGFGTGLVLLVAGLLVGLDNGNLLLGLGLAGFCVMLVSIFVIAKTSKDAGYVSVRARPSGPAWFRSAEERWRKHFERGNDER